MSDNQAKSSPSVQARRSGGMGGPMGGNMAIESARDFRTAAKRLLIIIQDQLWLYLVVAVALLASVGLKVLAPWLIGDAIKQHLELGHHLQAFISMMVLILVIYIVAWVVDVAAGILMNKLSMVIVTRIRSRVFAHVQTLSMGTFDKRGIGDMISRMTNDVEMIFNAMMNGVQSLFSGFFMMVGVLIFMLVLSPPLTLVMIGVIPVMAVMTAIIGKRIRAAFKKNQEWVGKLSANIEESISGVKVIKSFSREEAEFQRFDSINAASRDAGVDAELISFAFMPLMNVMTSLTLALIVGFGGWLALGAGPLGAAAGGVSVGLLSSFILYSQRFFEPLRQITQVYSMIQSAMAGAERVFEILDTKPEVLEKPEARSLTQVQGKVKFDNVSFAYEQGKTVLDSLSFQTNPGEVVAIVGPTGAGKTTLINLLSRFYDVESGSIQVDDIDIRDLKLADLRNGMGVVLQEPFFFATTIRENLLYARHNATEAEMIAAAQTANADYFISRLPQGYDTPLSERGSNLSQGERQLLGIARAILANPRILILDEATSSVDSLTESHIQEGLVRLMKGRTSFIIAHRLSTVRNADRVMVLHDRHIVESGKHDELMAIPNGFYAKLYGMQGQQLDVYEADFVGDV